MDNQIFQTTGTLLLAYFLGSLPFGLITGKLFYGKDIRDYGSKNIGATNVFRVFGKLPGIAVFLLDALKGYFSVVLIPQLFGVSTNIVLILGGLIAIAGHNWPVFLKFKGGKGVATSLGVALALAPKELGVAFVVFILLVSLTRFVSAGSICASVVFFAAMFFFKEPLPLVVFGALACFMIIIRHIQNIKRLYKGTENRLWQKKLQ